MIQKGVLTLLAFGVTSILLAGCWGKKDKAAVKTEEKSEEKTDPQEKKEEEH